MNNILQNWFIYCLFPQGAKGELKTQGTVRANFCPTSNKLISVRIIFDTASGSNILFTDPKYDKSDEVLEKLGYKN